MRWPRESWPEAFSAYSSSAHSCPTRVASAAYFQEAQAFLTAIDEEVDLPARLAWVNEVLTLPKFVHVIATSPPYKAGGPDGLTTDVMKCLSDENAAA